MFDSEFLRREWPGIVTWAIAIGLGIEAFERLDPQSTLQHVLAASAVSIFVLSIAALGLLVRQSADRRRLGRAGR